MKKICRALCLLRNRRSVRRHKGLSIMEVALASALLIAATVPILKSLTAAHVAAIAIEQKTYSLVLAQGKLEQIKARSIYNYSDSFVESNTSLGNSYLCNVSDDGHATLRTITVSVGYDANGDGALASDEIEVSLSTYLARRW